MLSYIENIERNRAAYRAALSRRASRSTVISMKTFSFNDLDERSQKAAILRYWSEVPAGNKIEVYFLVHAWRFNEYGERIA